MTVDYKAEYAEVVEETKIFRGLHNDAMSAFLGLSKATTADGALSKKVKELMALAIGVNSHCEGCIIAHVKGALKAGATLEEIAEAVGVSILMGGGPAQVYGAKAVAAAKQFAEEQEG